MRFLESAVIIHIPVEKLNAATAKVTTWFHHVP